MELPKRLSWLKSGRFLRLLSAMAAFALLAGILYNAIMIDRVPPTCSVHLTRTGANGQAMTLTSIDVTFSEDVQHDTAEAAFSMTELTTGTPTVAGTFHWQGQNKLIFTPSAKLPLSTQLRVRVAAGVTDDSGNAMGAPQDAVFTTVGPPKVASITPDQNASSVPVDDSIQITFDRIMSTQKVVQGLAITPDLTYQASWNGPVLTLDPTKAMAYGTTYTVSIGDPAVDTDGTKLTPYTATFKTVGIGLRVTAKVPAPNVNGISIHSEIAVTFDAPIDPSSVARAITLTPAVSGSTVAISLPDNSGLAGAAAAAPQGTAQNALKFVPDHPLLPNTTYSVTLSSTVKRPGGQVAEGQTWRFTTGNQASTASNQIAFISHISGVDNVWLINSDGSNPREVTYSLVPINGYDISVDGTTIAYGAGGVVKTMSIGGDNLTTLTPGGHSEYAPTITPDGTGVVVGRRDGSGNDLGYWRYSLVSGTDTRQVAPDGAPSPNGVVAGVTDPTGMTAWAPRTALTPDGKWALVVRGSDDDVELVDMTGAAAPVKVGLLGDSRPVWVQSDGGFYLAGSMDQGATWACWRVTPGNVVTSCGQAASDMASNGRGIALIRKNSDGSYHLAYAAVAGGLATPLTDEPSYGESEPSFSPTGSAVVFGRFGAGAPTVSAGIWTVNVDGTALTILATDGSSPRWVP